VLYVEGGTRTVNVGPTKCSGFIFRMDKHEITCKTKRVHHHLSDGLDGLDGLDGDFTRLF
jgi:hypothetical protein